MVWCNSRQKTYEDGSYVRLLQHERLAFAGFHDRRSPGVESRFTSTNVDATIAHIRERSRKIAEKNPFVHGRLRTHNDGASLWIPASPPESTVTSISNSPNDQKQPRGDFLDEIFVDGTDFTNGLASCLVAKGKFILDQDVPVVKLCVIRSRDKRVKDFILTLSASHVIGDISMIYKIWGMLNDNDNGGKIETLIQDRIYNYRGHPITGLKGAGIRKFLWYLLRSNESPFKQEKTHLLTRNDLVVTSKYVNMDWIEKQKKAHDSTTPGVPFLSTQDILTAWFFRQWDTAGVAVAYDMRHRTKKLASEHMGNYLEGLVLYQKEYSDPCNIRRAIDSQGKWQPRNNKPGKTNPRSVGGITGWHSRYVDLNLPHAERKTHLPLRDASGKLPTLKNPPLMILFKTSPDQYAIWALTKSEIKDTTALGDDIEL